MSRLVKIVDNKYVQIEEYKNPNICFNTNEYDDFENYCTLRKRFDPFEMFYENQELKKQLENKYSKTGILTNEVLYEENTKLINQQKEFINCLEDEYTKIQSEIEKETNNNAKYFKIERRQTITGILQKYKEIIGGKDER